MPRHFTEAERKKIKRTLRKAARKLFVKFGLSKTTIMDITEEVGIGKGSFYQFYNSKGDIFLDVYQIERENIVRKMLSMQTSGKGDLTEKLECFVNDLITILKNNPILRLMYEPGALDAIMDKAVASRLSEYNAKTNRALMSVIDNLLGEQTDSHDAAVIVGILRGITMLRHHISAIGPEVYEDVIKTLIDFAVRGVSEWYKSKALFTSTARSTY
jgi:AcrR family transcriptional regulator